MTSRRPEALELSAASRDKEQSAAAPTDAFLGLPSLQRGDFDSADPRSPERSDT
jgi:hypothetical protein